MAYLNDVKVLGHLSRDLKGRVSNAQTGTKSFASSTIAVSRHTANGDFTDFLPIKAWGKAADVLHEYTVKGSMLLLEGQLQAGDHGRDIFIGVTNVQLLETKEHTAELRQKVSDEEAQRASGNAAASQDPYASSGNSYAAAQQGAQGASAPQGNAAPQYGGQTAPVNPGYAPATQPAHSVGDYGYQQDISAQSTQLGVINGNSVIVTSVDTSVGKVFGTDMQTSKATDVFVSEAVASSVSARLEEANVASDDGTSTNNGALIVDRYSFYQGVF